ncbi:MAG: NAD(P)H-dependent glycerol-3-phosphate dehydrogenase [Candidatus Hydrothermales bacterium]
MIVFILGAGRWGTALSYICHFNFKKIYLWDIDNFLLESIKKYKKNPYFFENFVYPNNVEVVFDLEKNINEADIIISAVPTQTVRDVFLNLERYIKSSKIFISASKGLEIKKLERPSEIIKEVLKRKVKKIFVLSGPNFAEEIIKNVPSLSVLAGDGGDDIKKLQKLLTTPFFRIYISHDLKGVELGGALKNVYAIGAGILDGLNLGFNARAAFLTRSLVEMSRFGKIMGARSYTFSGLSGLGDLLLTSTSDLSRNRTFGLLIGKGFSIKEALSRIKTVEGFYTIKPYVELAEMKKIYVPIAKKLFEVLYDNKNLKEAIKELMDRPLKYEDVPGIV